MSQTRKLTSVLIASRIYAPESAAAAFRLRAVSKALSEDGTPVTVLTTVPAPGGAAGRQAAQCTSDPRGVSVSRWPALRDATGYVRGYLPYLSFDIPLFFRLLVAKRPGVILVEPPPTTGAVVRVVGALKHVPYVWYAADVWSDATEAAGAPALIVNLLRAVERFAVRGASGSIAVSDGVAERVRALGGRNVTVVGNGIDTETFALDATPFSQAELRELGIEGDYLVYAGTASEWQGASVFARAAGDLAESGVEVQVVFVGHGSEWTQIAELAGETRTLGGAEAVIQIPSKDPQWVARLLAGAKGALVSMVPGKGYDFAYPTKVLAALSAGRPVLYAGAGPVVEDLATHELGLSVTHDPVAVGKGMQRLLEREPRFNPSTLRQWVTENRSMSAMGRSAADFVLKVADAGRRKARGKRSSDAR